MRVGEGFGSDRESTRAERKKWGCLLWAMLISDDRGWI